MDTSSNVGLGDMILAATRGSDGDGGLGGNALLIVLIILIMLGGFGFNRGQQAGEPVTESSLCNANNFNDLSNAVGRLSDNQASIARQTDNAICNLGYETLQNFNATQQAAASQASAIQTQLAECCCTTQRAIDAASYNAAQNTASINETTVAQAQKVLDALCENKVDALQARINQLELQAALAGVTRYPSATTYTAGFNPYFNQAACGTTF